MRSRTHRKVSADADSLSSCNLHRFVEARRRSQHVKHESGAHTTRVLLLELQNVVVLDVVIVSDHRTSCKLCSMRPITGLHPRTCIYIFLQQYVESYMREGPLRLRSTNAAHKPIYTRRHLAS